MSGLGQKEGGIEKDLLPGQRKNQQRKGRITLSLPTK